MDRSEGSYSRPSLLVTLGYFGTILKTLVLTLAYAAAGYIYCYVRLMWGSWEPPETPPMALPVFLVFGFLAASGYILHWEMGRGCCHSHSAVGFLHFPNHICFILNPHF